MKGRQQYGTDKAANNLKFTVSLHKLIFKDIKRKDKYLLSTWHYAMP